MFIRIFLLFILVLTFLFLSLKPITTKAPANEVVTPEDDSLAKVIERNKIIEELENKFKQQQDKVPLISLQEDETPHKAAPIKEEEDQNIKDKIEAYQRDGTLTKLVQWLKENKENSAGNNQNNYNVWAPAGLAATGLAAALPFALRPNHHHAPAGAP